MYSDKKNFLVRLREPNFLAADEAIVYANLFIIFFIFSPEVDYSSLQKVNFKIVTMHHFGTNVFFFSDCLLPIDIIMLIEILDPQKQNLIPLFTSL